MSHSITNKFKGAVDKNGSHNRMQLKFIMGYDVKNKVYFLITFLLSMNCSILFANDMMHFRSLLLSNNFKQLEAELAEVNALPLNDVSNIEKYYRTYGILYFPRDEFKNSSVDLAIRKWIKLSPNSAYANFYAGNFLFNLGMKARGGKYRWNTPKENYAKMREHFKPAEEKLLLSYQLDSSLVATKTALIDLYSHTSDKDQTHIFLDSITDTPNNFVIWHAHLYKSTGRWGGGNDKIYEYLEMAKKEFSSNPMLVDRLAGVAYNDTVRVLIYEKLFDEAIKIVDQALPVTANYPSLLRQKAWLYSQNKDYINCIKWAKKAISVYPNEYYYLNTAGHCAHKAKSWKLSREYYYRIMQLDGESKSRLFRLGTAYMQLFQYKEAYTIFKRLLEIDPTYKKYIKHYTSYVEARHADLTGYEMKDLGLFDFYKS